MSWASFRDVYKRQGQKSVRAACFFPSGPLFPLKGEQSHRRFVRRIAFKNISRHPPLSLKERALRRQASFFWAPGFALAPGRPDLPRKRAGSAWACRRPFDKRFFEFLHRCAKGHSKKTGSRKVALSFKSDCHWVLRSLRMVRLISPSRASLDPLYARENSVCEGALRMRKAEPQALEPLALVAK